MLLVVLVIGVLLGFSAAVLLGVRLLLPTVAEAAERNRVIRESELATWDLHQQATRTLGRMLVAARDERREDDR